MLSELTIILLLILANGIFAGAEIAIVALRRSRLQELIEQGRSGARSVLALRDQPERFLATVQIGITVVSATAAAFGGAAIAARIEPLFAGIGPLAEHADDLALGLVIAVVAYLSIVIGELVPKSLALRSAERYALWIAKPLLLLSWLAKPLVHFLTVSSNVVLRPWNDRTTFTETRHSAEELQHLVEEAGEAGTVDPHAAEIASRALALPDLEVADVMIPRQNVVMVSRHASQEELRRIVLDAGHNRTPVYDGQIDNVVGYLCVKDLLALTWRGEAVDVQAALRPPYFVPEAKRAVDLLHEMRHKRVPFAMVVDHQGGLAGVVTMEDLLEELVGEIWSEHATSAPLLMLRESPDTLLLSGAAPLRDVNRELESELPEDGDYTTVAGLCLTLAAGIPAVGDKLSLADGSVLEIVDASPRRVRTVRLHLPPQPLGQEARAGAH